MAHLRQGAAIAGAPLAISGYGSEADKVLAREAGFDHHVVKPIDMATVTQMLDAQGQR
jgi:DNA-binding response OmpR family regulator